MVGAHDDDAAGVGRRADAVSANRRQRVVAAVVLPVRRCVDGGAASSASTFDGTARPMATTIARVVRCPRVRGVRAAGAARAGRRCHTTPRARSAAIARRRSRARAAPRRCARRGAGRRRRLAPGVADSFGTTPGTLSVAPSPSAICADHRRAPRSAGRRRCRRSCRSSTPARRRARIAASTSSGDARARPCLDRVVEPSPGAPRGRRCARAPDRPRDRRGPIARHQAPEDRVAVAGDQHVAAVARSGTPTSARCRAGSMPVRSRTAPKRSNSGSIYSITVNTASYSATSTTWPRPVRARDVERHQRADDAVQRGQRVADRDADARPAARSGLAGHVAQAAHRLADHAEAGPVAVRARSGRSPRCAPSRGPDCRAASAS